MSEKRYKFMKISSSCMEVGKATKLFPVCPVSNTVEKKKWIQWCSLVHPSHVIEDKKKIRNGCLPF